VQRRRPTLDLASYDISRLSDEIQYFREGDLTTSRRKERL
jgi:hypothetical protein